MYLIDTSIYILLAWAIWNFIWKAAVLDWARDHLFDLRDDARIWFMQGNRSLNDSTYKALRAYLNIYIRHIERATLTGFFFSLSEKNLEASKKIAEDVNRCLNSKNPEVNAFVKQTRRRAAFIVSIFMIARSFVGMIGVSVIFIKCVIQTVLSLVTNLICRGVLKSPSLFQRARIAMNSAIDYVGIFNSWKVEVYTREKA